MTTTTTTTTAAPRRGFLSRTIPTLADTINALTAEAKRRPTVGRFRNVTVQFADDAEDFDLGGFGRFRVLHFRVERDGDNVTVTPIRSNPNLEGAAL